MRCSPFGSLTALDACDIAGDKEPLSQSGKRGPTLSGIHDERAQSNFIGPQPSRSLASPELRREHARSQGDCPRFGR